MTLHRLTASSHVDALSIFFGGVTASTVTRTLGGDIIRFGVPGRTSAGLLKVRPGALKFPDDLSRVKLTKEHDRADSRGHLVALEQTATGIRAALKVADGPAGDDALREATDKTRDGFSFDVVDVIVEGDTITSGLVIAIGQVGIPAYSDTRVDFIAASQTPSTTNPGEIMLTDAQRARLDALRAQQPLTDDERTELTQLEALAAQPPATASAPAAPAAAPAQQVAASFSAVPAGVPTPPSLQVTERPGAALQQFVAAIVANVHLGPAAVTAALDDITHADHSDNIAPPAWSGELWSGLQYEPEFTPLLNSGTLTSWKGDGWRWVTKPEMKDYAGNKAEIPSDPVDTEASSWEAARMAVGHDIDRKFFDFPDAGFLNGYLEACRESWAKKLDAKVRAYIIAAATTVKTVPGGSTPIAAQPSLLKAAAKITRALKRREVGKATFIICNDDDFDTLFDYTKNDVPAFLELWGIDPKNFTSSADIAAGTVIGGVKQSATVRTLPGSPIRATAQNITQGGIDEAFFGYWAIEKHHPQGIAKATYTEPVEA